MMSRPPTAGRPAQAILAASASPTAGDLTGPHPDHRRLARRGRFAGRRRRRRRARRRGVRRWRTTPAPVRGNLVRRLGELLREHKDELGELVSIEAGKIRSEGLGEVQEMIDICDFAVGLSRQLHGLTIASERPGHRLMETWHPDRPVRRHHGVQLPGGGVVVERRPRPRRGDPVLWKPSDKTPLTALRLRRPARSGRRDVGAPAGSTRSSSGGADVGAALAAHAAWRDRVGDRVDAHGAGRRPSSPAASAG